jgi:phosphoglycolate phosphatase-like HAD superfamily hydrolase
LCVFDLDHTLVSSPLDLAAMALEMRAYIEGCRGPLPARDERYRVGELVRWCRDHAPDISKPIWDIALDHERRAVASAWLEPGAREALDGARAAGFSTVLWTNNAREVTQVALDRFALADALDLVVTRDDMAEMKPSADGWRVIAARFAAVREAVNGRRPGRRIRDDIAVRVGDSWVDGLAAAAAGIPFVAYRPREAELTRWKITPIARLDDLTALPTWLRAWAGQ